MTPIEFAATIGEHPIVGDILWRRGYTTVEAARAFLDPDLYQPVPPEQLPGMVEAVERLLVAIQHGERIRVWGDFDVDGQTATSVLVLGLRALGAIVDYTIPNRAQHSHGLNKQGIALAQEEGVRVLLTCDCGVTDYEEIAFARRIGLDVIISDHHDLGPVLPDVCAVINPKRLPADHPFANLPGVGVAYKLIEGLVNEEQRRRGEEVKRRRGEEEQGSKGERETAYPHHLFSPSPLLLFSPAPLLDLVALGIVADVAYQRDDTRYLLQRGLAQLRANPRPGLRALLRMANIEPASVSADSIGFQIGPRLNAVGRLDDATLSVELLTTEDEARATTLAAKVDALNHERRVLQRAVEEEAFKQIAQNPAVVRQAVIVLVSPTWHPSVLGVVASSVSNRYDKPAILISVRPGEVGRGSARSVRGVDIHAAITAQRDLIETSGGHPMAAGFAIHSQNVPDFRAGINQYVQAHGATYVAADDQPEAVLAWHDVSPQLCEDLERLAPFGPGNPRPLLMSERLKPVRVEPLGSDGKHQAVYFQDETGYTNKAMWWRSSGLSLLDVCNLIFTVQRETFRGKTRMQVQVVHLEPAEETAGVFEERASYRVSGRYKVVDRRGTPDGSAEVQRLLIEYGADNVQVWDDLVHGTGPNTIAPRVGRLQLVPKPILIILSAPPGPDELVAALARAAPQTVVLLTRPGPSQQDRLETVMPQLAGMIKTAEERCESLADPVVVARMAARIGQREATLRAGIEHYQLLRAQDRQGAEKALHKMIYFLDETRSYRRYFQEVAAEAVLRAPEF